MGYLELVVLRLKLFELDLLELDLLRVDCLVLLEGGLVVLQLLVSLFQLDLEHPHLLLLLVQQ